MGTDCLSGNCNLSFPKAEIQMLDNQTDFHVAATRGIETFSVFIVFNLKIDFHVAATRGIETVLTVFAIIH